jgi:hypothetical protein
VLHQRGGWWIDPDVVLLKPDLPDQKLFFAGHDIFNRTSTGALKFPKGHPIIEAALDKTLSLGDDVVAWEQAGASLLTDLIRHNSLDAALRTQGPLGPLTWFEVPDLFDPAKTADLEARCNPATFLQLHDDVWRRAGVPHRLGPPEGSLLDVLFKQHNFSEWFSERIDGDELNRWVRHLYQSIDNLQKVSG